MHKTIDTHISKIKNGDAIVHDGYVRTVCNKDIRSCKFMGISLFGDTYHIGHKPVKKVVFKQRKDNKHDTL